MKLLGALMVGLMVPACSTRRIVDDSSSMLDGGATTLDGGITAAPASCGQSTLVTAVPAAVVVGVWRVAGSDVVPAPCPNDPAKSQVVTWKIAPFALDRTEVTKSCYRACVTSGVCGLADDDIADPDSRSWMDSARATEPAGGVSHDDAQRYCRWRGGRLPLYSELVFAMVGSGHQLAPPGLVSWMVACGESAAARPDCGSILAQGQLLYPVAASTNASLLPVGTWSSLDVTSMGIEDLFGGALERTLTQAPIDFCTSPSGVYESELDEAAPVLEPAARSHLVAAFAGRLRGVQSPGENGVAFGVAAGPEAFFDVDTSYALGFRCAFDPASP